MDQSVHMMYICHILDPGMGIWVIDKTDLANRGL